MRDVLRKWTPREKYVKHHNFPTNFCFSLSLECSGEISRQATESAHPRINSGSSQNAGTGSGLGSGSGSGSRGRGGGRVLFFFSHFFCFVFFVIILL